MMNKLMIMLFAIMLILMLAVSGCKSDDDDNPADIGHANELAREGMDQLNTVILDLSEDEPDIDDENDLMLEATFEGIKSKFNEALGFDSDNPMANLGLAILEIVSINYDDELWDMIDDIDNLGGGGKRILNNQFQFLAQAPLRVLTQLDPAKDNAMSIMRMQNFVKSSVIPRLENSITRLGRALAMADSTVLLIDTGEETMEVDCGEIYAFRASVHAVLAAFNIMAAYSMDMTDANNGYQWMEDLANIEAPYVDESEVYNYEVEDGVLTLNYWEWDYEDYYEEAHIEALIGKIVKRNMDDNPNFGILTEPARLTAARNALLNAAADVISGTDYILEETDSQSNDVIKVENILSFQNDDLPPGGSDAPNFTQNWNSVEDICDWFSNFLTNSVEMEENGVNFTVNASAFFNGAIQDICANLPYYEWRDISEDWVENEIEYSYGYPYNSYSFWYNSNYITISNINYVRFVYWGMEADTGYASRPDGTPLDDGEMEYLPDYTFKGIFPGMTRAKYIQLFD